MAQFQHFSPREIEVGLAYAKEKFDITLDTTALRALADGTGMRWYREGRVPNMLPSAKREVLRTRHWEQNATDTARRNAYSSAISKMFSERAKVLRQQARAPRKTSAARKPPSNLFGFNERGQGVFLFPSAR